MNELTGLRGSGGNDDGVLHGIIFLERLDELRNGGALLADSDVDAVELLGLIGALVPTSYSMLTCTETVKTWTLTLIEHGIESDGGLASLTITDDQLTLTTTDGDHGVDGLEASLHGLVDGLTGQDTGSLELGTAPLSGLEGTLSIDGVTESIDNTSKESLADGDIDLILLDLKIQYIPWPVTYNLTGTLDSLALLDQTIGTEEHNTDLTGLQVHAHALDTGGEPGIGLAS